MTPDTPRPPLRLGFIGGGVNSAIGATHRIACQMDGAFELVAGCFSRDPQTNRATGRSWGLAPERVHAGVPEFLAAEAGRLDAVVVLTPTPTHTDIVIACLEHGLAVVCEKALAASARDVEAIGAAQAAAGGRLLVTFNYTGYPMVRELRQRIADGELGTLSQVMIEMPQEGFLRHTPQGRVASPQPWRRTDGVIPTVSLDLGVHVHQMVDFLTGAKARHVYALDGTFGEVADVVDTVNCLAHYDGGLVCNYWYGKAALGHRNGLRIRIFGSQGSAEWLQMDPELLRMSDVDGGSWSVDRTHPRNRIANQPRYCRFKAGHPAGFIEAFANHYGDVAAVLHGGSSDYVFGPDVAHEGLQFLDRVHESARLGQRLAVGGDAATGRAPPVRASVREAIACN